MRLKKSCLRRLIWFFVILAAVIAAIIFFTRDNKKKPTTGYFSTRCLDYKQKEYCRKLNDRIVDYLPYSRQRGIKVCRDDNDVKSRIAEGKLVNVRSCNSYVVEKMIFSYPVVTRDSKELIDEIASRLRDKVSKKGLKGVKFYITSMTRKTESVRSLRKFNGNASVNSPHMFGNAFDISYKRFVANKWVLTNCDKKYLKEALAEVIWQLRAEKKCWATYERIQNCYHVVAR